MFDAILKPTASVLDLFYGVFNNFTLSIVGMTLLFMVVTTPLTLKGTKSMIKMQLLQPELKRIQQQNKDDRQKQQEEMMRFYQENEVNPVGGCLPLLIQMPIFLLLYNVIKGLTRLGADGTFDPKYLSPSSGLYQALAGKTQMQSFGLDLGESTLEALRESVLHGIPYLILVLAQVAASYYQQRQVSARNKDGSITLPAQQMMLRVMPVMFGVISLNFPAALVVYWVTQSLWRIGLQAYITRSLYHGDESMGAQAQRASVEAKSLNDKEKNGTGAKGELESPLSKAKQAAADKKAKSNGHGKAASAPAKPVTSGRVANTGVGRPHPSSKKKKKKRR
jgi:YidC/Oxa1 family membrane protein insertase